MAMAMQVLVYLGMNGEGELQLSALEYCIGTL